MRLFNESVIDRLANSVVFTYWTKMLDLIQNTLEANAMVFERIDGRTTLSRRIQALDRFNSDPDCRIMLATIGSVGEGYGFPVLPINFMSN